MEAHADRGNLLACWGGALADGCEINPFRMLPLMGLLNVRARELAGFSILQLLVHAPIVFLLCWALSYTF
ncbi:MAG: hypothetical protein FJ087_14325 [Deltaproteobacteria bacterium]|nr:hypothetical protein [Deltaproteobacteria bacterium]